MTDFMPGIDDRDFEKETWGGTRAYILPGLYVLEINKAFYKLSRKKKPAVIFEFVIVESSNADRPVGTITTRYCDLEPERSGAAEMKAIIGTACGIDPEKIKTPEVKDAIGEKQPLAGRRVVCRASNSPNPKSGKVFTDCVWEMVAAPTTPATK